MASSAGQVYGRLTRPRSFSLTYQSVLILHWAFALPSLFRFSFIEGFETNSLWFIAGYVLPIQYLYCAGMMLFILWHNDGLLQDISHKLQAF